MSGLFKPPSPPSQDVAPDREADAARAEELARQYRRQRLRAAMQTGQAAGSAPTAAKTLLGS